MKLSYRGVSYESNPLTLEVTESEILGKYRGANWHCHTLKELPIPQPNRTLTYRGVLYNTNQTEEQNQTDLASGNTTRSARSGAIPKVFPIRKQTEQVHRTNLLRNLERRLQVAKEHGDQNLINLLEAESKQLVGF
ncbi:MAG: DUF4278 domain-containing protein [Kovacikia sp.]